MRPSKRVQSFRNNHSIIRVYLCFPHDPIGPGLYPPRPLHSMVPRSRIYPVRGGQLLHLRGAKLFHSGHTPRSYSCPSAAHSFTSAQLTRTVVSAILLAGLLRLNLQLEPLTALLTDSDAPLGSERFKLVWWLPADLRAHADAGRSLCFSYSSSRRPDRGPFAICMAVMQLPLIAARHLLGSLWCGPDG